jgi:hypothetical protein
MIELGFLFMISPFSEEIIWVKKPDFPIDMIWNTIHWPFEILYQNGDWSPNVQYDFQLERVRILVLFFWLLLLTGLSLFITCKKKIWIPFIIASIFVLALSYCPASLYRLNRSWNGINSDQTYYDIGNNKDFAYKPESEVGYRITDYDLHLFFGNELTVSGKMKLSSDKKREVFYLTLYHGYKIQKLSIQNEDVTSEYHQSGDQIEIQTDKPLKELQINIKYRGHHNKYYANSTGAMLPGFLPWYPMAGNKQIYQTYSEYGGMSGYNPYNRITPAHIRLQTNKAIFSNVNQTDRRHYEGTCDSITVLMGNLQKCKDPDLYDVLPLDLWSGYKEDDFIAEQKEDYQKLIHDLKNIYGLDTSQLDNKKILFASEDMGRNNTNNFFSVFQDYILVTPGYLNCDTYLHYLVLGDSSHRDIRQKSPLIRTFLLMSFDTNTATIKSRLIEEIKAQKTAPEEYSFVVENADDWIEVLKKTDSQILVRKITQYMIHPDLYGNDNELLAEMRNAL